MTLRPLESSGAAQQDGPAESAPRRDLDETVHRQARVRVYILQQGGRRWRGEVEVLSPGRNVVRVVARSEASEQRCLHSCHLTITITSPATRPPPSLSPDRSIILLAHVRPSISPSLSPAPSVEGITDPLYMKTPFLTLNPNPEAHPHPNKNPDPRHNTNPNSYLKPSPNPLNPNPSPNPNPHRSPLLLSARPAFVTTDPLHPLPQPTTRGTCKVE